MGSNDGIKTVEWKKYEVVGRFVVVGWISFRYKIPSNTLFYTHSFWDVSFNSIEICIPIRAISFWLLCCASNVGRISMPIWDFGTDKHRSNSYRKLIKGYTHNKPPPSPLHTPPPF